MKSVPPVPTNIPMRARRVAASDVSSIAIHSSAGFFIQDWYSVIARCWAGLMAGG